MYAIFLPYQIAANTAPGSKKAKQAIAAVPNKKSEPKIFELDLLGEEGQQMQDYLLQKTGQRTVPNVFIGQKHIGGKFTLHLRNKVDDVSRF